MKYKVTLNGKTYEVEVEAGQAMLVDEYEAYAPAPAAAPAAAAPAAAPAAPAAAPAPAIFRNSRLSIISSYVFDDLLHILR